MSRWKRLVAIAAAGAAALVATAADAQMHRASGNLARKDLRVLREAPQVLDALTSAPDRGIPTDLLERAECVVVFPDVTKGAFIVGGRFGRGVATCRGEDGAMGAPAFFTIGGASVGWQFGGKQTDLVLLVMNEGGMRHLLASKFTIGGEASAAVGPVGRTATAATDAQLNAQILAWSRSQGLFVGAALDGAVVKPNDEANTRLYGDDRSARDVLLSDTIVTPAPASEFVTLARQLTGGSMGSARSAR